MISNIDNDYTSLLIKGAINAAREKDINIIIYPGRGINEAYDDFYHTEYEFQNYILYEYISKDCLDGVILSAGTVLSWLTSEERKKFVGRYGDLPILVLENEIEGYPLMRFSSIGIKEAIKHLIEHCGRRKIGFVAGIKGNADAEERLLYYKETLKECGLPVMEDYIAYGDFSEYSEEIVGELLDRHKGEIDALCFANDNMCIGGYKALAKRGLVPGKDIAVTGYDDSEVALSLNPLLTTVKADAGKLGYCAVETLLKIIKGEKIDKIILDSTLVVRESSGEALKDVKEKVLDSINNKKEYMKAIESIFDQNIKNYHVLKTTRFIYAMKRLFIRLIEEIKESKELDLEIYFMQIWSMWRDNKESDIPMESLGSCIKELKKYVISLCKTKQQKLAVGEIIMAILGRAYDFSISVQIAKRAELVQSYFLMNNIKKDMLLKSITGRDDESGVYESILINLHDADFKSSYLYMFKEPFIMHKGEAWNIPDKLYLKAYHEEDHMVIVDEKDQEIEWKSYVKMLSEGDDRQRTMILTPIYSDEEQHGLFLCEVDFEHFSKVKFVNHQISYAMKQADLLKQLENYLKELEVAKQMAERASEAKANFLANMSHEIRTPINSILGMNEMILRESKDEDIMGYAHNIKSAGRTLLSIINDILDFSKIESGKMDIILAEYEISSLINDLVNMISERVEKKNLKLELDFPPDLPSVLYGDEIRIRQVIMNLLTNAVKYTDKGTVTFRIKWQKDGEFAVLLVSVEDTGRGIKEEDLPKIFHAFERIEEKKNKNIEGTGLGMSIIKQLLELMDSDLNVESIYGKGSKFSFVLKQKIIDESPIGNFASRFNKDEETIQDYGTFTAPDAHILVVDDNAMNLLVVQSLLKVTKIHVDTADSGFSWIEKMKYNRYDLVFVDHMMPDMDGIEALQKVKEMQSFIDYPIPVIILTANAIAGSREKYMGAGFTDYLSKPIDSSKLEHMLIKHLPKHLVHISAQEKEVKKAPKQKALEIEYNFLCINTEKGLYYSGNHVDSYKKILKVYQEEGQKKREVLHKAFLTKDKKQYLISIHTLKSTSQNIGAEKVAAKAERMEAALKEDDWNFIMQNHEAVLKLYENVLEELEAFFAKNKEQKVKKSISKKELIELLNGIREKIYTLTIVEAVNKLEILKDCIYESMSYEKQAQKLISMLRDYDVEGADEYLEKLLESLL